MPAKKVKARRAKTKKLSEEELLELKKEFDSIDIDNSGELDKMELVAFMTKNNLQPEFANLAIKLFDSDSNGQISFNEFVKFTKALAKLDQDPNLLQKMLFATLDKDGNGYLDIDEILSFLSFFTAETISEEDVSNIISNLDSNDDGKLSFEEIMSVLQDQS